MSLSVVVSHTLAIRRPVERSFPFGFEDLLKRKVRELFLSSLLFYTPPLSLSPPSPLSYPSPLPLPLSSPLQRINVEVASSERALLAYLLAKIHRVDPDIIVV